MLLQKDESVRHTATKPNSDKLGRSKDKFLPTFTFEFLWRSSKKFWDDAVEQYEFFVDSPAGPFMIYLEDFGFIVLVHSVFAGLLWWMGALHEANGLEAPGSRILTILLITVNIAWVGMLGLDTLCAMYGVLACVTLFCTVVGGDAWLAHVYNRTLGRLGRIRPARQRWAAAAVAVLERIAETSADDRSPARAPPSPREVELQARLEDSERNAAVAFRSQRELARELARERRRSSGTQSLVGLLSPVWAAEGATSPRDGQGFIMGHTTPHTQSGPSSPLGRSGDSEPSMCSICWEKPVTVGFLHNNFVHKVACSECAERVFRGSRKCPLCRKRVEAIVSVYE